jgi:hypothetical protein
VSNRFMIAFVCSALVGSAVLWWVPWPSNNAFLVLLAGRSPMLALALRWAWYAMGFSTPFVAVYVALRDMDCRTKASEKTVVHLPVYVEPELRDSLWLTLGEIHHERNQGPVSTPRWLNIPAGGLVTGLAVIGSQGSGKTSSVMHPAVKELFSTWAHDPERKIGGLILEVKGDICFEANRVLESVGRKDDYIELGFDSGWAYNPLASELDAYALASAVGSLIVNTFGRSLEPFWQMAYTNLIKFVILLYRLADGYVTFVDVYRAILKRELICEKIDAAKKKIEGERFLLFTKDDYKPRAKTLKGYGAKWDDVSDRFVAPWSPALENYVEKCTVPYEPMYVGPAEQDPVAKHMLQAVLTWYYDDYVQLEPKMRMNIAESITVFLSLFDSDYQLHQAFCPSQKRYENGDRVMRGFKDLIETGKVVAVNFPAAVNEGVAKIIGVLIKLDYERAVINRIPEMIKAPERYWRHTAMIVDEYQMVATAGERDSAGDDKFFSLSRQPKCIPIIAMQSISSLRSTLPGESWRTVLQLFRTKLFLTQTDDFSAQIAAELCGREDQYRAGFSLMESGHDSRITIDNQIKSRNTGVSTGKSYQPIRDYRFQVKDFMELPNYVGVVLAYNGRKPLPPTRVYLRPAYLDRSRSYFDHQAEGAI